MFPPEGGERVVEPVPLGHLHRHHRRVGGDAVDRLRDGVEVGGERHLLGALAVEDGLEDGDAVLVPAVPEHVLGGRVGGVQVRREERRVDAQREQGAGDPQREVVVLGDVLGAGDLVVGLDRGDEALGHHGAGARLDVGRVDGELVDAGAVGHRVVAHRVAHVRRDPHAVDLDGVTEVVARGLAHRGDRPHPVGDQPHPLGARRVERGRQPRAHLRGLRPQPRRVEGLGAGRHLGVVEPQLLLEADEVEQPSRHPTQVVRVRVVLGARAGLAPPALRHRVELVLQPDDRLVVVEGAVAQLRLHGLGVGGRARLERLGVRLQHLVHPRGQIRVAVAHAPRWSRRRVQPSGRVTYRNREPRFIKHDSDG